MGFSDARDPITSQMFRYGPGLPKSHASLKNSFRPTERQPLRSCYQYTTKNVIYEGTPHGKAELAYFYFYFLLVLNLIYFAAEYVELYTSMYSGFFVTALQMCGATDD